jgi:hypothetical protein
MENKMTREEEMEQVKRFLMDAPNAILEIVKLLMPGDEVLVELLEKLKRSNINEN